MGRRRGQGRVAQGQPAERPPPRRLPAPRARTPSGSCRTNPYEGGSDHTAFGDAGMPSLLNWHFTDRYYHTNLDRPDKTSAAEMVQRRRRRGDERVVPRVGRRARRASRSSICSPRRPTRGSRSSRSRAPRSSPRPRIARRPSRPRARWSPPGASGTARRSTASDACPPSRYQPRSTPASPPRRIG